jgi:hypothetical protein
LKGNRGVHKRREEGGQERKLEHFEINIEDRNREGGVSFGQPLRKTSMRQLQEVVGTLECMCAGTGVSECPYH